MLRLRISSFEQEAYPMQGAIWGGPSRNGGKSSTTQNARVLMGPDEQRRQATILAFFGEPSVQSFKMSPRSSDAPKYAPLFRMYVQDALAEILETTGPIIRIAQVKN